MDDLEVRPHDGRGKRTVLHRLYFERSRIAIIGDNLDVTTRWGRTRRFPLPRLVEPGAVWGVVFVFVWLKAGWQQRLPYRKLLVVAETGETLMSFPALRTGTGGLDPTSEFESVWSRQELRQLCAAAGLSYDEESYPDTEALHDAHPGAMNGYRFYAHPHRYASLVVVAILATIVALILVQATIGAF
jgi:hypothetical protein